MAFVASTHFSFRPSKLVSTMEFGSHLMEAMVVVELRGVDEREQGADCTL